MAGMLLPAIILLFIGKVNSSLTIEGLERYTQAAASGCHYCPLFSALVRCITIAFTTVAALGRVGIETSPIVPLSARRGLAIGWRCRGRFPALPQAYCLSPAPAFTRREIVPWHGYRLLLEKGPLFSPPLCSADSKSCHPEW
ncbi:hypothetical protein KCP76_10925 [Salmonella enterica subsp. enterica serovar Weltevreden]|nr:hypothetical protein KCP76_10925 [Salmonella enterica subsp. enterica serovar Weltevreden]